MRTVRLTRPAFINGTLCDAGSVVQIADDTALAPFMVELPADPAPVAPLPQDPPVTPPPPVVPVTPAPAPAPAKTVTVHYNAGTGEVDIDVDGVSTRIDHAALKIETD